MEQPLAPVDGPRPVNSALASHNVSSPTYRLLADAVADGSPERLEAAAVVVVPVALGVVGEQEPAEFLATGIVRLNCNGT